MADTTRRQRPPVFQIGLAGLGTAWLREVFAESGYAVVSGERTRLSVDVRVARLTGGVPLEDRAAVDVFTDLEPGRSPAEPPVAAADDVAFLHEHFPDAFFVLNTGDVDRWLAHRARASGGAYLRAAALRLGVTGDEVLARWEVQWRDRRDRAVTHFGRYPRFAELEVGKDGKSALRDLVGDCYRIHAPRTPRVSPLPPVPGRARGGPPRRTTATWASTAVVDAVVAHATRQGAPVPHAMPVRRASHLYVHWDGSPVLRNRRGVAVRCHVDLDSERWPFLLHRGHPQDLRTEGALNELWQHGGRAGAHVDMQDARSYGTHRTGAPAAPVLTYCRTGGAANLVLWPLAGYHTPGTPHYPDVGCADPRSFGEKRDTLAWRGNLTGRALAELGAPPGYDGRHATELAALLGRGHDEEVFAALLAVPRFRVVSRLADREDADLGFVLGRKWGQSGSDPVLRRLAVPRMGYPELYEHRYLLSLSGNDTGSNFLKAADSNSVVLREEDGWELFYSGLFRPWEHYIPVWRGGDDIEAKLEWARSHPRECQEMSANARRAVRALVDPTNRIGYLGGIREVYESRLRA